MKKKKEMKKTTTWLSNVEVERRDTKKRKKRRKRLVEMFQVSTGGRCLSCKFSCYRERIGDQDRPFTWPRRNRWIGSDVGWSDSMARVTLVLMWGGAWECDPTWLLFCLTDL